MSFPFSARVGDVRRSVHGHNLIPKKKYNNTPISTIIINLAKLIQKEYFRSSLCLFFMICPIITKMFGFLRKSFLLIICLEILDEVNRRRKNAITKNDKTMNASIIPLVSFLRHSRKLSQGRSCSSDPSIQGVVSL